MIANDAEPRASPPAELVVEGIDKWFRTDRATTHAIEDMSFRVAGGNFVCLVGPSGCGQVCSRRPKIAPPGSSRSRLASTSTPT